MVPIGIMSAGLQELQLADHTQKLERIYQECLRAVNATQESEDRRRLRLTISLFECENEDLQRQTSQREDALEAARGECDTVKEELHIVAKALDAARDEVRVKTRQVESLQTECDGLRGLSTDSAKLLSEKLALARELSLIRPELDHLRSQVTINSNAVSEKQSLQRQLRAVEVELENEKRAMQKTTSQSLHSNDRESKIMQQLKKELKTEAQERQRIENEAQEAADEFEDQKTKLESRLQDVRAQLTQAKEDLAVAHKQLRKTEPKEKALPAEELKPQSKKRNIALVDPDAAIGTPGDLPPNKRGKRITTQPGEKSNFSITPFLNRTGSVAPESPASSPTRPKAAPKVNTASFGITSRTSVAPSPRIKPSTGTARIGSLGNNSASRRNARPGPTRAPGKSASAPKLDQVLEEEEDENEVSNQQEPQADASDTAAQPNRTNPQPLAKRKILLGKTIFDDDEDGMTRPKPHSIFGNKSAMGNAGKFNFSRTALKSGASPGRPVASFGSFSPRKGERKLTVA